MELRIIGTIARHELREQRRNRWFLLMAGVFASLALALSFLGLSGLGTFGIAGFGRTTASVLHLVMVIVPLMGLLMGAMSIAVEREQGTLLALMAQPVTPAEVLLGKFLGAAAALTAAILIGFGASGAVVARYGGLAQLSDYLLLIGFAVLLGLAQLALGFALSVVARRGATAVGLALFTWLAVVLLSDLGIMGAAMILRMSPAQLLWASLVNPIQAFKLGVTATTPGALDLLGPSGRYAADVLGARALPAMGALLLLWTLAPLAAALGLFHRRGAV